MYIDTRVYRYTCISTYLHIIYIYTYTNIHVYHICLLSSRTLLSGQHRPAAAPTLKPFAFPTLRKWHRARTRRNHGSTQRIKNSLSHVVVLQGTLGGFLKRGYSKIGRMSNVGDNVWCLRLSCRIILGYPILRNTSLNVLAGFGCKRTIGKL